MTDRLDPNGKANASSAAAYFMAHKCANRSAKVRHRQARCFVIFCSSSSNDAEERTRDYGNACNVRAPKRVRLNFNKLKGNKNEQS